MHSGRFSLAALCQDETLSGVETDADIHDGGGLDIDNSGGKRSGRCEKFRKGDNNKKDKCLMSLYRVPDPVVSNGHVYLA